MRIPTALLAPLVIALFFGIMLAGDLWELPSMKHQFAESAGGEETVEMIVRGLQCRGTSNFFIKMIGETPGILSATTYVQEYRAVIKYDPSQIDVDGIKHTIEKPVRLRDGRTLRPFKVLEILDR